MASKKKAEQSDLDLLDLYGGTQAPSNDNGPGSSQFDGLMAERQKIGDRQNSDLQLLDQYAPKPEDLPAPEAVKPEKAQPKPKPGPLANSPDDTLASGSAKNAATAAIKGAASVPGFAGNAEGLSDYLFNRAESAISGKSMDDVQARHAQIDAQRNASTNPLTRLATATDPRNTLPNSQTFTDPVFAKTGEYRPTTEAGQLGAAALEGGVGAIAGSGIGNALTRGGAGSVLGAAGQGAVDATGEPLAGLAVAGAVPAAAGLTRAGTNALIGKVSPERAALADAAMNKYGIPLGLAQAGDSTALKYAESTNKSLPFGGGKDQYAQTRASFNNAVAGTFGESAPKITGDVLARARDRIGQQFDDVAAQTPQIALDRNFTMDVVHLLRGAETSVAADALPAIRKQVANILDTKDPVTGAITGAQYQSLTAKNGMLGKILNQKDGNADIKNFAGELKDALDGAFERSASPQVVQQLQQARYQYKNMRTIEELAAKAPEGDISPALLQGAVNTKNKGTYGAAYGGGGDLKELANIGQAFLKEPPNSGTAQRLTAGNMLTGGAISLGTAVNSPLAFGATLGAGAGGLALNRLLGSGLRSPQEAQRLVNRSLGRPNAPGLPQALSNASVPFFANAGANALLGR